VTEPFPASVDEFFHRLETRHTEDDLRVELHRRLDREQREVSRIGNATVVVAVCERLLPSDSVPSAALAAFIDEIFDQQTGRGDEASGLMPRERLIPAGFEALNATAQSEHRASFAELDERRQDDLLARAETGDVTGPEMFDSRVWFQRVRELALLGYGSDPRGMVEMGFPGPSYRSGHVWLSERGVRARVERRPGFLEL
jgi:hypothetical protein